MQVRHRRWAVEAEGPSPSAPHRFLVLGWESPNSRLGFLAVVKQLVARKEARQDRAHLNSVSRGADASPTRKWHVLQEDLVGRQATDAECPNAVAEGLGNLFFNVRVPKPRQQRCK